jgi:hypothetical protein
MFPSKTIGGHLLRGAIAAVLIAWALLHQESHPVVALTAGAVALVAMRGCPLCWTLGLVATVVERAGGGRAARQHCGVRTAECGLISDCGLRSAD